MSRRSIEIGTPGIRKTLNKFDPYSSFCQYIWNGFDAGATEVSVEFDTNEIGTLDEIRVIDNGCGIPLPELDKKFRPFQHTNKIIDPSAPRQGPSALHGKNGVGRLTFFKFSQVATWTTVYKASDNHYYKYKIKINADSLNNFDDDPQEEVVGPTGTTVCFNSFMEFTADHIPYLSNYLALEFAWYLELASPFKRIITINGEPLNYEYLIGEREVSTISLDSKTFDVQFIRWDDKLNNEYSRYYFISSDNKEKKKKHTTFNNKGDDFFHSLYVRSDFFDTFNEPFDLVDPVEDENSNGSEPPNSQEPVQLQFPISTIEQDDLYKDLIRSLEVYIRQKRKPFLRRRAVRFIQELSEKKIIRPISTDPYDIHRENELKEILREIYEVDPRIFRGLSNQQTETIVQLFYLVMRSDEREDLLSVLSQVVKLDHKERAELANILQTTQLSNIIATIKLIEDRFTAVSELKKIVFNPDFGANERDNLQSHIERHYWLFGEKYHLISSAEQDFEDVLRRYLYILWGENKPRKITHPDRQKEMDIFMVRCRKDGEVMNHVVVELKHPCIKLGAKEFNQVRNYMDVILKQPEFIASNREWDFYLVGNDHDDYIKGCLETCRPHGVRFLAHSQGNYKIFVLTWSEIIANFELSHDFLLQKLKLEREKLATKQQSADDILAHGQWNTAIERQRIYFPKKPKPRRNGKVI